MSSWKSKRQPTKDELREMLAEAVRNTQPQTKIKTLSPLPKTKKVRH
jgi:hypothetical protein